MNTTKIIEELKAKYSNKFIVENKIDGITTEILCEVEPTTLHPEYSFAVAVIEKSLPHYHINGIETYKVIDGELTLHLDNEIKILKTGDEFDIPVDVVHWAEGKDTWVECTSRPGWTIEDHLLISQ